MGKHKARRRAGRSVYVLGTCCGTLTVAAFVSAVHPVPEPLPRSSGTPTTADEPMWSAVDASPPVGGPLEVPTIGAGLKDYDEQIEALTAARAAAAADEPTPPPLRPAPPNPAPAQPAPVDQPVDGPPPVVGPTEPPPVIPEPPGAAPQPPDSPPGTDGQPEAVPAATPPAPAPPTPTSAPPAPEASATGLPTGEPPTGEPPTDAPPTDAPPTDAPPTDAPPTAEPPPDGTLAIGERYERLDADGTVLFAITLVEVDADLPCTSPDSLPAENGHLIGLRVEVLQELAPPAGDPAAGSPAADPEGPVTQEDPALASGPPTEIEQLPFGAADFRFVDADDVLTADVDTASSAACLPEATAWPAGRPGIEQPVTGTVVLDVPATAGTIVYRPAAWPSGVRWQL